MINVNTQKLCKVCTVGAKFIIVQFDSYGLKINIEDTTKYKFGDDVLIDYTGTIGKKDFQYALSVDTETIDKPKKKQPVKNTRKTKRIEDKNDE